MWKRMSYFNKLLLVIGISAGLSFAAYVYFTKRSSRYYYIPADYQGWVTIRYEKPGAPPLPMVDGAYHIHVPASGIVETSTSLEKGWARDEHYWVKGSDTTLIPKQVELNEESHRYIHSNTFAPTSYKELILSLPEEADTSLDDGARISKQGDVVDVQTGRERLEHFFVTQEPKPFFHRHDSLPEARKIW